MKVVTPDLAFIVENERAKAKVDGRQDFSTIALRVTTIFQPEEGVWKIVHRHADPIVSNQPVETLIQE
ncbi:MAG: nuclear transport factor 2 family protein [Halobacteriota archaeon]